MLFKDNEVKDTLVNVSSGYVILGQDRSR